MRWFITKRGDQPYNGPTWKKDTPRWFASKQEAAKMAFELTERNPVGFSVKSIPTGYVSGTYPLISRKHTKK
jgi:hypothetical protein